MKLRYLVWPFQKVLQAEVCHTYFTCLNLPQLASWDKLRQVICMWNRDLSEARVEASWGKYSTYGKLLSNDWGKFSLQFIGCYRIFYLPQLASTCLTQLASFIVRRMPQNSWPYQNWHSTWVMSADTGTFWADCPVFTIFCTFWVWVFRIHRTWTIPRLWANMPQNSCVFGKLELTGVKRTVLLGLS